MTPEQLEYVRDFNYKYKFRFVELHKRKLKEHREKAELDSLRKTQGEEQDQSGQAKKKKDLEEKMKLLESNETAIKIHLGGIDRYISEKNAWSEFIRIEGVSRLVKILDRAIASNKKGTKTIFQSQIEILKFLKSVSEHCAKEYFGAVGEIEDYTLILLRGFHPVNVAVTAYVLMMLQDYAWKVENSRTLFESLNLYKEECKHSSVLEPFVEAIYETDNILMCYYNMRFINEVLISMVDDSEKASFEEELRVQKYELLIEDIKGKLQENYYKIEYCTFISVSQKIYKFATQSKKKETPIEAVNNRGTFIADQLVNRGTVNLNFLQQALLSKFAEGGEDKQAEEPDSDDDDNYITVYLSDNDKKTFNKFILDTFSEIQHYYKYTIIVDELGEGSEYGAVQEEVENLKKYGLSTEEYVKRMKGSCMKYGCEEVMLNCLKNIQYFEKPDWKKLEVYVTKEIKNERSPDEPDLLRRQLEDKEKEVKTLKKEMFELKADFMKGAGD